MLIKTPIKSNNNKLAVCSWILEKFPRDYENMNYIEPFIGNGTIFLNKLKSKEEVAGDINNSVVNIWKAIRDENKAIRYKLSKLKYNEKYFNLIKNKKIENDYFKEACKELILRKMSKAGNKEVFEPIERKKSNKIWKETSASLQTVEKRISDSYFLSKTPKEIIVNFDDSDSFCFCCPPVLNDKKLEMTMDDYVAITDSILSYRGKVVFCGNNCTFYRRVFKDWKLIKNKSSSKYYLWVNF